MFVIILKTTGAVTSDLCLVCGSYRKNNPQLSFHQFPIDPARRSLWVRVFELGPEAVKPHRRACSWHFFKWRS